MNVLFRDTFDGFLGAQAGYIDSIINVHLNHRANNNAYKNDTHGPNLSHKTLTKNLDPVTHP